MSISESLQSCRTETLALFTPVEDAIFCRQLHPEFSPVGWHLGHIAFTEAYWILEQLQGFKPIFSEYRQLFAADGLPKTERQKLPSFQIIEEYLQVVRDQVLDYLAIAPIEKQERLWWWLIQHETQHQETIAILLQLSRVKSGNSAQIAHDPMRSTASQFSQMITIPPGEFLRGCDRLQAQDNERTVQKIYLDSYQIDTYPVTCKEYQLFIEKGGYHDPNHWSKEGWQWKQENLITQPLYWIASDEYSDHPVYGVSWYEAQAYANFIGKRLPSEAEWEKAASWDEAAQNQRLYPWGEDLPDINRCNYGNQIGQTTPVTHYDLGKSAYGCRDMLGNVWEWTDSCFAPYPHFQPYPYPGYSQVYFDQQHRVLRGGSWATGTWGLRNSFRNWYHPWVRQILAGFRCAI
jgi:ergothioneine biosynthesis protein EgtB